MSNTSTGIEELDKALMNGIPEGYTILVMGPPGAGMELFAKQFASVKEQKIAYFSTNERTEDLKTAMKKFGWNTDINIINIGTKYYENVLARKLEISRFRQEGITMRDIREFEKGTYKEINFVTFLTYEISKLEPPFRIIIDSLDFFFENYDHHEVLSAMRTIIAHIQHKGGVALFTMLKEVYDAKTVSGVEGMVDAIIELERDREKLEFKKYLVIRKVRNYPDKVKILPYSITHKGITPSL